MTQNVNFNFFFDEGEDMVEEGRAITFSSNYFLESE